MDKERPLDLVEAEWAFPFDHSTVGGAPVIEYQSIRYEPRDAKNLLTIP